MQHSNKCQSIAIITVGGGGLNIVAKNANQWPGTQIQHLDTNITSGDLVHGDNDFQHIPVGDNDMAGAARQLAIGKLAMEQWLSDPTNTRDNLLVSDRLVVITGGIPGGTGSGVSVALANYFATNGIPYLLIPIMSTGDHQASANMLQLINELESTRTRTGRKTPMALLTNAAGRGVDAAVDENLRIWIGVIDASFSNPASGFDAADIVKFLHDHRDGKEDNQEFPGVTLLRVSPLTKALIDNATDVALTGVVVTSDGNETPRSDDVVYELPNMGAGTGTDIAKPYWSKEITVEGSIATAPVMFVVVSSNVLYQVVADQADATDAAAEKAAKVGRQASASAAALKKRRTRHQ